ncbi:MAG TPA: hypothetical protein VK961_12305 [Chthoniobacter sp.]|nr:hypothetical protein [Chthoniobacter sp.]
MKSETLQDSGADLALFRRRHPWLTAIVSFVAMCVVVFFCLEWRAEQRWQRYAAEARVRGVKLMLTDFAQPEIPDEQNFAALPMMRKISGDAGGNGPFYLPQAKDAGADDLVFPKGNQPPSFGDLKRGPNIDLAIWQDYFHQTGFLAEKSADPARDVLQALEHFAPELREWSEWRTRPECRFPLDLTKGIDLRLPYRTSFVEAGKVLTLRMRAHLVSGDSPAAYSDFQDALQAYRLLLAEPSLISGLVRTSILHTLLDGVGDGLQNQLWGPEELDRVQSDLSSIRLMDDWRFALASERASFNTTVESWLNTSFRERGRTIAENFGFVVRPDDSTVLIFQLCPRGVFRDGQLRMNRYLDELLARIDTRSQTLDIDGPTPSFTNGPVDTSERLHYFLFFMSVGICRKAESRLIFSQTILDEARLACALERFRVKHGAYPETLAELPPEIIAAVPIDPYSHAPYRYQRAGSTSFRLYGVGENRTDDGGQIAPGVADRKQLDAVWPYAPLPSVP